LAKIEFEEREYETALYHELESKDNHLWAPGQVLEALIGFDYSTYTENPKFWKAIGLPTPPPGYTPQPAAPAAPAPPFNVNRDVPDFSLNLFIQAKRPHSHRLKAEEALAKLKLGSPRWKFKISPHQQDRLEILATATGSDALVCYAAPVFHEAMDLYKATLLGSIIDQSTFPTASKLASHSAWNYSKAGSDGEGIANTELERISEGSLTQRLSTLIRERGQRKDLSPAMALERLWAATESSIETGLKSLNAHRKTKYQTRRDNINALRPLADEKASMVIQYLHLMNYSNAFGTKWLVISPEKIQKLGKS
jgi:hypothetical protein